MEEDIFSSSCHVFMTEIVTSESEVQRRASAFQIEPTKIPESDEYKEFPNNADSIISTIEDLYKKISEDVIEEEEDVVYENVSPSSNSDSGIFKDSISAMGAVGGGAAVGAAAAPPLLDTDLNDVNIVCDESFNTERLENQNSADNLRQSMQRYLATKHQHLKMASEQLLNNRPSEFRQTLANLPPYQPPPKPMLQNPSLKEHKVNQQPSTNENAKLTKSQDDMEKPGNNSTAKTDNSSVDISSNNNVPAQGKLK